MKTKNLLISAASIILSGFSVCSLASLIPQGEYINHSMIASIDDQPVISSLKVDKNSVYVNGVKASESNAACSQMLPGGPCSVDITWDKVTATVSWPQGTLQAPSQFFLEVTSKAGHKMPRLMMIR